MSGKRPTPLTLSLSKGPLTLSLSKDRPDTATSADWSVGPVNHQRRHSRARACRLSRYISDNEEHGLFYHLTPSPLLEGEGP